MGDLTNLERRVLMLIQEHFARTNGPLTIREMASQVGHRGVSSVQAAITHLASKGYLIKSQRNGRIIGTVDKCPTCGRHYPQTKQVVNGQSQPG